MKDIDDPTITRPLTNLLAGQSEPLASLVILSGDSMGRMLRLGPGTAFIGRSPDAQLSLDDQGVSRMHVKIFRGDEGFFLEDLGSKNGTLLNGEPLIGRAALKGGDKFQLGKTIIRFTVMDSLDDQLQQRLYDASVRDGLTGVFNRRFFDEVLTKEFAFAERHDIPLSLLMIDVDHFKRINDSFGHPAGDAALTAMASCLTAGIRTEDVLARYGGEEFVILLRELTEDVAIAVAERLRRSVESLKPRPGGTELMLTISVGVATHIKGHFKSDSAFLASADSYLLMAKSTGRNRVCSRWLG